MAAIKAGVFDNLADDSWRGLFVGPSYPYERPTWDELLLVGQHTSRPLGVISAMGSAILVVGLCALLAKVPWARVALTPVRAAGAMTLTLYTMHVLWSWRLKVDFLNDHPDQFQEGDTGVWLLQVAVLATVATIWSLTLGKGPLEWLVRRLSVWGRKEKSAP
jgi:uncharacterized membrane protein YeiB